MERDVSETDGSSPGDGDSGGAGVDYASLQEAFIAGFVTGRTGSAYGSIAAISRRAAVTEFEQYYRHQF
jgi:hypothetical protein